MSSQSSESCFLRRVSEGTEHAVIALHQGQEITIGRSIEATVHIPSVMISRTHAHLRQTPSGDWTITDCKSLNGIRINGVRISPDSVTVLNDGDTVQLGVEPAPDKPSLFVWKFNCRPSVKRLKYDNSNILTNQENTTLGTETVGSVELNQLQALRQDEIMRSRATEIRHEAEQLLTKQQLEKQAEHLEQITALLEEKEQIQRRLEEELRQQTVSLEETQRRKQEEMELEKLRVAEEMRASYERKMAEQESSLMERLNAEKESLTAERVRIETSLQVEMAKKLEEKDRVLEERLRGEKERLDEILEEKEAERIRLEQELTGAKCEVERIKVEDVGKAKDDMLANLAELMESELQCGICTEVFVKPVTLNCAHSFCACCAARWMKIKKVCPTCRTPIATHLRSYVLDSYIEKMVEQLSDEMKAHRKRLVQERIEAEAAETAAEQTVVANNIATDVAALVGSYRNAQNMQQTGRVVAPPAPRPQGRRRAPFQVGNRPTVVPGVTSDVNIRLAASNLVQGYNGEVPNTTLAVINRGGAVMAARRGQASGMQASVPTVGVRPTNPTRGPVPATVTMQHLTARLPMPGGGNLLVTPARWLLQNPAVALSIPNVTTPTTTVVSTSSLINARSMTTATFSTSTTAPAATSVSNTNTLRVPPVSNEVTVVSDAVEDSSNDDSDEEYYYRRGRHGRYYVGYGSCYSCGRPGHWANDCPYD